MNVEMRKDDGVLRVMLEGRLNSASAKDFSKQIEPELEGSRRVELDFAKLEYISSAGLRVLLSAHKAMAGKNGMTVKHVNEIVGEVFEVTGFSDILTIE